MVLDPTKVRLSRHFMLSDFLGNHSVYSLGLPNMMEGDDPEFSLKMHNAKALCEEVLEPLLERHGPLSISYGYIRPEVSDKVVHYQDPRKPSHHMWNLGAAADICAHNWANRDPDDDTRATAPIELAHQIHLRSYPYSRLITYSESPFICLAVSALEVADGKPRKAFYENRYMGVAKAKPHYRSLASDGAKAKAHSALLESGLPHGWRGAGYPTYHGRGRRQFHHVRVSDYTMASDWLFDRMSIANGHKNVPTLIDRETIDAFNAAGSAYDAILRACNVSRMSIVQGFLSESNPSFRADRAWMGGLVHFTLQPPDGMTPHDAVAHIFPTARDWVQSALPQDDGTLKVTACVRGYEK